MSNVTIGTVRNQPITLLNAAKANGDSPIFALFSKPIEPHYITILPVFNGAATGTLTAYLGQLDPSGNIVWEPSAGTSSTSGTPIVISGKPAQFLKVTVSSFSGSGSDSISATAVIQ
jgi:hypothetical protein